MFKILREPLLQFIVVGVGLFFIFDQLGNHDASGSEGHRLVVDEEALLTFMQLRSKAFNEEHFRKELRQMSVQDRQLLIDDYIREEVLYREAKAMGLEKDDYIIRRRLVQMMEFIMSEPTEEEVAAYFEANRQQYWVQPFVTFTHVFFDAEKNGWDTAREMAQVKLSQLNVTKEIFANAVSHGDRFPFHLNYIERVPEFVVSRFGAPMAKALFKLNASDQLWQGPFESPYGVHVVMLSKREEGRFPKLAEVYQMVREDARREQAKLQQKKTVDDIVASYDVQIDHQLGGS